MSSWLGRVMGWSVGEVRTGVVLRLHISGVRNIKKLKILSYRYEIGKSVYRSGNGIQNRNVR